MLDHLANPEYLHVLLNPLPVYGLAVGLLALIIALLARVRAARISALAIIFVSSISIAPVAYYGDKASDAIVSLGDEEGNNWLKEHERRTDRLILLFYATAALSAAALISERFAARAALALCLTSAVLATATLAAGGYIAAAGGRIRHREFRYVPAPAQERQPND